MTCFLVLQNGHVLIIMSCTYVCDVLIYNRINIKNKRANAAATGKNAVIMLKSVFFDKW